MAFRFSWVAFCAISHFGAIRDSTTSPTRQPANGTAVKRHSNKVSAPVWKKADKGSKDQKPATGKAADTKDKGAGKRSDRKSTRKKTGSKKPKKTTTLAVEDPEETTGMDDGLEDDAIESVEDEMPEDGSDAASADKDASQGGVLETLRKPIRFFKSFSLSGGKKTTATAAPADA